MAEQPTEPKVSKQSARKAEEQAERERKAKELLERRVMQLRAAEPRLRELAEGVTEAQARSAKREALVNHLTGFYDEVDKLAKGRTMIEATHLIVEQANDIIRDTKSLIQGDVFLDRVKEFVPAGTNPVYPDVLLVARTIQQALGRSEKSFEKRVRLALLRYRQARTIVAALEIFTDDPDTDPVSKDEVAAHMDEEPDKEWFFIAQDREYYFNFDRLDENGIDGELGGAATHE